MPILGDFAVKYASFVDQLGVPMDDLYQALVDTAENTVSCSIHAFVCPTHINISSLQTGTWVRNCSHCVVTNITDLSKWEGRTPHGSSSDLSQPHGPIRRAQRV